MIVFHGGFSKQQIDKLRNNEFVIYPRSNYETFRINQNNTFKYSTLEKHKKKKELINNIIDENYLNQWIHCFKYLYNTLDFCYTNNFIVVFDIDEYILEKYIGVGNYKFEGYKIEYRIPRKEINNSNIIDIIPFKSYDLKYINDLKQNYSDNFYSLNEHFEANKILKKTNQKFNYL